MYTTTQDRRDYIGRVASHATKGSPRGVVSIIPQSAYEALAQEIDDRIKGIDRRNPNIHDLLEMQRYLKKRTGKLRKCLSGTERDAPILELISEYGHRRRTINLIIAAIAEQHTVAV